MKTPSISKTFRLKIKILEDNQLSLKTLYPTWSFRFQRDRQIISKI